MTVKRLSVKGLAKLPAFSHATEAGGFIYVSGTLGTLSDTMALAAGGIGPETVQVLRNIETVLAACGAGFADVMKINVFLTDMDDFPAMNEAYIGVIGEDGPARITVGRAALALNARVEMDCVAYRPPS